MGRAYENRREELAAAVRASKSFAGVMRYLGLRIGGANYGSIKRAILSLCLDTAHWTGQGHRKGSRIPVVPARDISTLLIRGSTYENSRLSRRLLAEGILDRKCSGCELETWLGVPIPLELDHIDGDRDNNELANLRFLCPNCHALTPTYKARNIRLAKRLRELKKCPGGEIGRHRGLSEKD